MTVQSIGLVTASFTGINGSGAVSVPGLKVGDRVISCYLINNNVWQAAGQAYEYIVSVNDEIQQLGGSFSTETVELVLIRGGF